MTLRAFLSLTLAATIAVPLAAQVRKAELAGVRNYSKVDATVGCAGATDPSAMKALKAEGCNVLEQMDDPAFGKFGWVVDPDGNKIELWEPPEGQ